MSDLLALLKIAPGVLPAIRKNFFSFILVVFALVVNTGIQSGGFVAVYDRWTTSQEQRHKRDLDNKSAFLQEELRAVAKTDDAITRLFREFLDGPSGNAVRLRLAIVHNGTNAINQVGLLKYDIVLGVAERGRAIGDLLANRPLSQWSPYLPDMLDGKCKFVDKPDLGSVPSHDVINDLSIQAILACPVMEPSGALIGALFLTWDSENASDARASIDDTVARLQPVAAQVGLIYSLRPRVSELSNAN